MRPGSQKALCAADISVPWRDGKELRYALRPVKSMAGLGPLPTFQATFLCELRSGFFFYFHTMRPSECTPQQAELGNVERPRTWWPLSPMALQQELPRLLQLGGSEVY